MCIRDSRTVFVADTHFGKAATFRAHGIPVGNETQEHDLGRLAEVVFATACERLVILGDLVHSRRGRSPGTLDMITEWRRKHSWLTIELVKGNHDQTAGPPLDEWAISILHDCFRDGPFVYRHHPTPVSGAFVLAGHLHPKVVLPMEARGKVKLSCFWVSCGLAVLPAFGSFIDSAMIRPAIGDLVFSIADGTVFDVTPLLTARRQ